MENNRYNTRRRRIRLSQDALNERRRKEIAMRERAIKERAIRDYMMYLESIRLFF